LAAVGGAAQAVESRTVKIKSMMCSFTRISRD
jgi:hypothetical protein